jgi:dinuclear metal center YbgI/SA1388 family protein
MDIKELVDYSAQFLQVASFKDYAPNGLQVEGRREVRKIVSGVTASMALLEAAVEQRADLVLVHHGYFWNNEDPRIIGMKKKRLALLLKHEMNLMAYHLPLDAHAIVGNNVQLGKKLGVEISGYADENKMVAYGFFDSPMTTHACADMIQSKLQRRPLFVGPSDKVIKKIAWCTGAAQSYIHLAQQVGADAYLSGEISEQTTHIADEGNIVYFSAGHHATERYGVQALGEHLAEKFHLEHVFVDLNNPV